MSSFVEECLAGEARLDDIDNFVAAWHEGDDERPLNDYLGMSTDEYALWVEQPASLRYILFSRRHDVPLEDAVRFEARAPVAARAANQEEAQAVLEWLRRTGRIE